MSSNPNGLRRLDERLQLINAENSVLFKNIIEGCKNIGKDSMKVTKRLVSSWKK